MTTVLVGTQVQLRAYLASTNSMDFHIDVRNDCKKFTVFMWEGEHHRGEQATGDLRRPVVQQDGRPRHLQAADVGRGSASGPSPTGTNQKVLGWCVKAYFLG